MFIIAAGPRAATETFARSWRPGSRAVSRGKFGFSPRRFRRSLKGGGTKEVALHAPNWQRRLNPQLDEILLTLAPTQDRFLADDATGAVRKLGCCSCRIAVAPWAMLRGVRHAKGIPGRIVLARSSITSTEDSLVAPNKVA